MSSKLIRKGPGLKPVFERTKKPGTVDVGIIDAGQHASGDITVAGIGFVHEYGAEINHPGGTPYKVLGNGRSVFVKKGTKGISGVTKPHVINIPERSFMRSTTFEKKKEIIAMQKKLLSKVISGEMPQAQALGLIGEFVSDAMRQKIVSLKSPANKAATVRKKGSSNPLVDTGQLKNSITYEVNS